MIQTPHYHHGNLKEELLATATKLLDEHGVEAIGIRQLAKALGVAHSAPANHFKNKQILLGALNDSLVAHFIDSVQREFKEHASDKDALKHFAGIVLHYGLTYPNRYRFIWQSEQPLVEAMEEIYQLLTGMLQTHARQKQVDVESQAIAVWSLIHGYVVLRLDGHLSTGQDAVTGQNREEAILDVILNGVKNSD